MPSDARQPPGFLLCPRPWPRLGMVVFKQQPADFQVEEMLPFELSGEGEHLWLWVEKIGQNTEWVARQLARWAGVRPRDVGYAGLKDRQAVTRQWFSLWLPGRPDPDLTALRLEGVRVLDARRHGRKLQTGALSGNRFVITLRSVSTPGEAVEARLAQIMDWGFPNCFGQQRFGHQQRNWTDALEWVAAGSPRVRSSVRSRHLSVLRSGVFNAVLAERVAQASWHRFVPGDVLQLNGSERCFVDDGSPDLAKRVAEGDLHPTGPLPGEGGLRPVAEAGKIEQGVLALFEQLEALWQKMRMKQGRRALRVLPQKMGWHWQNEQTLTLTFQLPAGSYATALLHGLFDLKMSRPDGGQ